MAGEEEAGSKVLRPPSKLFLTVTCQPHGHTLLPEPVLLLTHQDEEKGGSGELVSGRVFSERNMPRPGSPLTSDACHRRAACESGWEEMKWTMPFCLE